MRMSVMGQGRARVGCCSVAGTDCSAPAAILDAFLRLDKKGIVKPGESKKGLEMGILVPTGPSTIVQREEKRSAHSPLHYEARLRALCAQASQTQGLAALSPPFHPAFLHGIATQKYPYFSVP